MRIVKYTLLIALFAACSSGSEEEKPDTAVPVIELQNSDPLYGTQDICGFPDTHVFSLLSGQTLYLDLHFSDDVGLSQYKIDIHHNFDCHTHGRTGATGEPWFVARIEKIDGVRQHITEELTVPDNVAAGNYHLLVYGLDQVGNEAKPLVFSMKIKNSDDVQAPELTVATPASETAVKPGDSILFEGEITDNSDLPGGRIELFYYDPANTLYTVDQYFFPVDTRRQYLFSIPYHIGESSVAGIYQFHIKVYDQYNNATEKVLAITVN
ncbi:DUF4625 domain-containing protein [Dawidia soli]|uniref:DUF4625 domain-containing protein n=1 Tax=Dawidia soli TaxID=2782352 RepID=A0AAP2DAF4_9BACT|nr:DUF4625 domain-containing protein [Dawidia soli]MBT1688119.1 DUF4625 domain-containing protein [Dawidia soli]